MHNEHLLYLQEISDISWVIEVISEKFDNAINLMTANSMIYGGAIRDCLAGKDLDGDLDILVPVDEYSILVNRFINNSKWIPVKESQKDTFYNYVDLSFNTDSIVKSLHKNIPKSKSRATKENKKTNIRNTDELTSINTPYLTSFKTLGNRVVQIISPCTMNGNYFQTLIHYAKQVDIVCCGMILTNEGRLFEVVPNAYKDCKNNILHINPSCIDGNVEKLKSRIKKFISRGWNNDINKQTIRNMERKQKRTLKQNKINPKEAYYDKTACYENIDMPDCFENGTNLKTKTWKHCKDEIDLQTKGQEHSEKRIEITIPPGYYDETEFSHKSVKPSESLGKRLANSNPLEVKLADFSFSYDTKTNGSDGLMDMSKQVAYPNSTIERDIPIRKVPPAKIDKIDKVTNNKNLSQKGKHHYAKPKQEYNWSRYRYILSREEVNNLGGVVKTHKLLIDIANNGLINIDIVINEDRSIEFSTRNISTNGYICDKLDTILQKDLTNLELIQKKQQSIACNKKHTSDKKKDSIKEHVEYGNIVKMRLIHKLKDKNL